MLENATYSILSPEGFASILWKDGKRADEAAGVMKITAEDLRQLHIVERVFGEHLPQEEEEADGAFPDGFEEINENAACFTEIQKFTDEKIDFIKRKIEKEFDTLCTGCNYCAGCPQNIKINQLMLAYNQYVLTDNSVAEFRSGIRKRFLLHVENVGYVKKNVRSICRLLSG